MSVRGRTLGNRALLLGLPSSALTVPHSIAAAQIVLASACCRGPSATRLRAAYPLARTPIDLPPALLAALTVISALLSSSLQSAYRSCAPLASLA